ncbi:SpoIIE family protein phosphatase [Pseudonocardia sp.]|uniref:SpoIIE family protein phosphatase n=1 Tax=Pseudonocardia sp. TaxID=60912 RepID=UPI0026080E2D|nr:SpoIIE family protein phosphatase [Pseudonocardia sp.]
MPTDPDQVFSGGGLMGRVMAGHDWAATSVGAPQTWPSELRSVVRILLTSRFSMWMGWGPELAFFYNDAYQRDTLRSKHPWALGRPAREVWAEIWDDIGPRIQSVLDTGEATWDEGLLLTLERSGYPEETYHTFSYSPLHDAAGRIAGFLCVVSEDTERVLGERRLRVLSELGDISAVTAPTLDEACTAAVAVLQRGRADVPYAAVYLVEPGGDTARLVAAHGTDPAVAPPLVDAGRDPQLWAVLDSRRAVDAGDAVAMPLTGGGGGRPAGVLLAGVNPHRALDREYRRFLDLVAGQVSTAIADASAFQLQRRRADELAELDRAKTAFFTGVSHELRTPLTLIAGPAEDALADTEHPLPPVHRARLELVHRSSGRLRRLVDTILEFSRLEDGRAVPDRVTVDLAGLTRGIAESFAPAVTRAGLAFTVTCPELPGGVAVDVDMWEKIVLNLLSNAVKYTHAGSVTLELARADPDSVVLRVADTGIGIPEADVPLLFQRFHRVRGASGRSHEGSGIGLALVSELAALHGGSVAVDSVLGEGSRFTVTIPSPSAPDAAARVAVDRHASGAARLYRDEALQWSGAEPKVVTAMPDAGSTAGATVLVAEDNPDLRRFLGGLLEPHYSVLLAADGAAALERARTARPDLVLTDVMMPGLDGFGLLAALRTDPATATTPVVMLSARAGEEAAIEGLHAGADDYLAKPFSSADLVARVRSNLELARVRRNESAHRAALINAMQDGLFVMTPDLTVVETNAAFHSVLGHDPSALPVPAPHPWWPDPDTDPDAAAQLRATFDALDETGTGSVVVPLIRADGLRIWADVLVDSVRDADGAVSLYVGTLRDVTLARRAAERDRLLADAGRLLAQPGELTARLGDLVHTVAPVLGDLVTVLLPGPDGRLSPVAAAHHRVPERAAEALAGAALPVDDELRSRMLKGHAFAPADHPEGTAAAPEGDLVVPLVLTGRLLGCLVLARAGRAQPLDGTDVATAEELGRRVTMMIEAERLASRERQLHVLTAALAAAGTVAAAARVLADGVAAATGAEAVAVVIRRPGGRPELVAGTGDQDLLDTGRLTEAPGAEPVQAVGPVWPHADDPTRATLPLRVRDRTVGTLLVGFAATRSLDDDDRAFLTTLATEGGLAFERAALADTRRELADTLQRSLLPPELPEHPRLTLAARYLPAASGSRTGGDWYDVLLLDEHRVAIVVGDVVGQGPAAAAVMGQLRSALSAYLLQAPGPAQALTWLDRYSHRVAGARASAAICVVLDTRTGDLRWARAGHPPPLVIDAAGAARYLDGAHGCVLGVRGAPPFTECRDVLGPGGTVVLYTDGLVERRGENVDEGFDRLARAASAAGRPVGQLVPALLDASLDGSGPADDVALIVARLRPAPLSAARPAVPPSLAAMRRDVEGWAARGGLAAELVDDLQLALGEAVANSVEHAYGAGAPGEVRYRVDVAADDGVTVEVADDGTWRPPGEPGFRGRGLQVIHSLSREFALDHDDGGTRLRFVLPPPAAGPHEPGPAPPAGADPVAAAQAGGAERLVVSGELDLATVPALRADLRSRLAAGPVVLDLSGVTYLASAGIGLLLEAAELAPGRLRILLVPDGPAARAVAITGLDRYLPIDPS